MDSTNKAPWQSTDILRQILADNEYAYLSNNKICGCTRDQLIARCERLLTSVDLVWTPEHPLPTTPESIDFLFEIRRERLKRQSALCIGLAIVLLFIPIALLADPSQLSISLWIIIITVFTIIGILSVTAVYKNRQYKRLVFIPGDPASSALQETAQIINYNLWLSGLRAPQTMAIGACIVMVGIMQLIDGLAPSVQSAGLVKDAARAGEWWRLFTCSLLHGSFWHFWMNAQALIGFGRLVEVFTNRVYVPIIFLASVFTGSLFSLFLYPHTNSVGASGGIMGLVGFLAVLGYRRKANLPPQFFAGMKRAIIATAVIGVLAFFVIDNAAHVGGLICGTLLGLGIVKRSDTNLEFRPAQSVVWLGQACFWIMPLLVIVCLWAMFRPGTSILLPAGLAIALIIGCYEALEDRIITWRS